MIQGASERFTISVATPADRPGIAAVHVASWRDAYGAILPPDYLGDPIARRLGSHWSDHPFGARDVVLVASRARRVAGFAATWDGPTPLLDNLHVDPALRGQGLGLRLIRDTARALRATGRNCLMLWVLADNTGARRFYARLGGIEGAAKMRRLGPTQAENIQVRWDSLTPILANTAP